MVHEDTSLLEGSMGMFKLAREELRKLKSSGVLLPNRWGKGEDPRFGVFLCLGWLIADLSEFNLDSWTPRQWTKWIRDILDMIDQSTEP